MGQSLNCLDKTTEEVEEDDMPEQRVRSAVESAGKDDDGDGTATDSTATDTTSPHIDDTDDTRPASPVLASSSSPDVPPDPASLPVYTLEEVAKHSTDKDAWMVVHGKVFDVTPFMGLHPGGPFQLMRGAGKDATELFEYAHPFLAKGIGIRSMQPIGVLATKPPSTPALSGSGSGTGSGSGSGQSTAGASSTPTGGAGRGRAASAPRTPRPVPDGFRDAVLVSKTPSADDAQTFTLRLTDGGGLGLSVGQHVDISAGVYTSQTPVTRPYTPIGEDGATFSVAVRLYPAGAMSRMLRQLRPGDPVHVRGPLDGPVTVDPRGLVIRGVPSPFRRVFLLAGGSGITPMYQIMRELGADRRDAPTLHVLYSGRSSGSLMLSNDIRRLALRFTNIRVLCNVTRDADDDEFGAAAFPTSDAQRASSQFAVVTGEGRVSINTWRDFFPAADPAVPTAVLTCGPGSFNKDMASVAVEFGIPESCVAGF